MIGCQPAASGPRRQRGPPCNTIGDAVAYAVVAPDGTFTSSAQLSGMDRNGQSFIGTNNQSVSSAGGNATRPAMPAGHDPTTGLYIV
jgi:hypothetical protein